MRSVFFFLALLPLTVVGQICECPLVNCLGDDVTRCRCANDAAIACASRCSIKPSTIACPTPTSPPTPTSTPCRTRGPKNACAADQSCIPNPNEQGCSNQKGNCPGVCVRLDGPQCGGFAGFGCPEEDQVCVDDPRDDCGGPYDADCIGVCVRLDGGSSSVSSR